MVYFKLLSHEYVANKQIQSEVRKAVRNAKRNIERKLAGNANKNNTKPFYSYVGKGLKIKLVLAL